MAGQLFYLALTAVLGIATVVVIPRHLYRKFLIYGLITGGVVDAILQAVLGLGLNLFRWLNLGPANLFGLNSLAIISFTPWLMLFLYFLPLRRAFLVVYILAFTGTGFIVDAAASYYHAFTGTNLGRALMPFVFLVWYSGAAWFYRWQESIIRDRPVA